MIRALAASGGIAAAATVGGCGGSSITEGQRPTLQLGTILHAAVASDVTSEIRSLAFLPVLVVPEIDVTQCSYSTADQAFACPPVTLSIFVYRTSFVLLDADGRPLTQPTTSTLATLRATLDVTADGEAAPRDTIAVAIHRHSVNTLSGLLTSTPLLNGSATEHDTLNFGGSMELNDATTTTTNYEVPTVTAQWPTGGTIRTHAINTIFIGTFPAVTERDVLATFNGTSKVPATVTEGSSTQQCTIDLAIPTAISCN